MIIISLDKEDNWGLIRKSLIITKYYFFFSIIGYFLTISCLRSIKFRLVQYLKFDEDTQENRDVGLYVCGLFSQYLKKNFYLICGEEFIPYSDYYFKGYRGEKFGNKGLDSYLRILRRKVKRLQGG